MEFQRTRCKKHELSRHVLLVRKRFTRHEVFLAKPELELLDELSRASLEDVLVALHEPAVVVTSNLQLDWQGKHLHYLGVVLAFLAELELVVRD